MTREKCDEIKMEISSCFVKKHEYWVRHHRGKNWIAKITGLDTKYGYQRVFLKTVRMGREKVFQLKDFRIGEIYEVVSVYYTSGRNEKSLLRDTFECTELTETHVVLKYIPQDEVVKRFGDQNKNRVAENLVAQLLKVVTEDEAVDLIHKNTNHEGVIINEC